MISRDAFLQGEYGLEGRFVGVPAKLGAKGMEGVIEIRLNDDESKSLKASANAVLESQRKLSL